MARGFSSGIFARNGIGCARKCLPLIQVRTKRKAIARMLEVAEERLGGKRMAEAAVIDRAARESRRR